MAYLAQKVNDGQSYASTYFVLMNDLDLNQMEWTPIGNASGKPFAGHFNGQGHAVQNMKITEAFPYAGLFGLMGNGSEVKNLAFSQVNISINYDTQSNEENAMAGAVAGVNEGTITNCHLISGSISMFGDGDPHVQSTALDNEPGLAIGGIAGVLGNPNETGSGSGDVATIVGCSNAANLYAQGNSNYWEDAGGIVGGIAWGNMLKQSLNTGTVTAKGDFGVNVGGIACETEGCVSDCENRGVVKAIGEPNSADCTLFAGGIAAENASDEDGASVIENCLNVGIVSAINGLNYSAAGGIAGFVDSQKATLPENSTDTKNCLNLAEISASSTNPSCGIFLGGVVGMVGEFETNLSHERLTNCFYDKTKVAQAYMKNDDATSEPTTSHVVGLDASQLKTASSYPSSWPTDWNVADGSYPSLKNAVRALPHQKYPVTFDQVLRNMDGSVSVTLSSTERLPVENEDYTVSSTTGGGYITVRVTFTAVGRLKYDAVALTKQIPLIHYVKVGATGNGTSWSDAGDLQAMIDASAPGDQVFVARGTYMPHNQTSSSSRDNAFHLKEGVKVYGGFIGTESTPEERTLTEKSLLSGNIGTPDETDNCYNVVISVGCSRATLLDGFAIEEGYADESGSSYLFDGKTIRLDCGGGMQNVNSSPTIVNCALDDGYASGFGGGVYNADNASPLFINCIFDNNSAPAASGGAMCNKASAAQVVNCTFGDNNFDYNVDDRNDMCNDNASPLLVNSIFEGSNPLPTDKSIVNINGASPRISYCMVEGCGGSGNWNSDYGIDGGHNLDVNPQYDDNQLCYTPAAGSPLVDAGSNTAYFSARGITTYGSEVDFIGNPRFAGASIDLGAAERLGAVPPPYPNPSPEPKPVPVPTDIRIYMPGNVVGLASPGAFTYQVPYGDNFDTTFVAAAGYTLADMKVYANEILMPLSISADGLTARLHIHLPLYDMLLSFDGIRLAAGGTTGTAADAAEKSLRVSSEAGLALQVSGLHSGTMLYIYNVSGRLVCQIKAMNVQCSILKAQLKTGVYVLVNDGRSVKAVL
ncbi:MAG: hypothetical protein LBL81_01120 [Tannerella sp.]|nr:hypothetical protein [Tannerella sp.]